MLRRNNNNKKGTVERVLKIHSHKAFDLKDCYHIIGIEFFYGFVYNFRHIHTHDY